MGIVVFLVLACLVNSRAQYFDPVLFEQDGKGEVSSENLLCLFIYLFHQRHSWM